MGMSKAKKARLKQEREGQLNPEIGRGHWHRKPHTQVVMNKKADQRRTQCRLPGSRDGADSLLRGLLREPTSYSTYSRIAKKCMADPASTNRCQTA